jgi:TonB family protein
LKKALFLSFFFHAAAIAAALYLHAVPGSLEVREESKEDFVVEAPLGHVFVQEEALAEAAEKTEPAAEKPMTFPEEVKTPETAQGGESAPGPSGTPDGEAQPIGKIEPSYPPVSRRLGEQGEAVFVLTINADGSVAAAELEKGTGFERLDIAARAALLAATFAPPRTDTTDQPAKQAGQPAGSRKRFRVEFRLEEARSSPDKP